MCTAVLAALVSFTGGTAAAAPAYEYPTWPTPPLGANDWTCSPNGERPHPAVIVHGTSGDSRYDEVVVPYSSAFLTEDAQSTNITLQDRCPADAAEHLTIVTDPQVIAWLLRAFGREGPADPAPRSAAPADGRRDGALRPRRLRPRVARRRPGERVDA